jgi:dsRNA-specific ribonuclease
VLSDVVEALVGAVFTDNQFDLPVTWQVLGRCCNATAVFVILWLAARCSH